MLLAGALKTISTNSSISRIGTWNRRVGLNTDSQPTDWFLGLPWQVRIHSLTVKKENFKPFLISSGNPKMQTMNDDATSVNEGLNPVSVHILCSLCYALSSILLFVPCVVEDDSSQAFSLCLISFVLYEVLVGFTSHLKVFCVQFTCLLSQSMCSTINIEYASNYHQSSLLR